MMDNHARVRLVYMNHVITLVDGACRSIAKKIYPISIVIRQVGCHDLWNIHKSGDFSIRTFKTTILCAGHAATCGPRHLPTLSDVRSPQLLTVEGSRERENVRRLLAGQNGTKDGGWVGSAMALLRNAAVPWAEGPATNATATSGRDGDFSGSYSARAAAEEEAERGRRPAPQPQIIPPRLSGMFGEDSDLIKRAERKLAQAALKEKMRKPEEVKREGVGAGRGAAQARGRSKVSQVRAAMSAHGRQVVRDARKKKR